MTESVQKQCVSVLRQSDLFSAVSIESLERLLSDDAVIRSFKKGAVLYSPESTEKYIGVLLNGEARVTKDHVTVSVLKRGMQFGAVVLYNDAERFINTITAKTECKVLLLKKTGIDRLMQSEPQFALSYVRYLSKRIYFLNTKIEAYTAPNGEEKLLQYLLSICDADGSVSGVSVTELSRQINVSRAGIYRALDSLCARGKLQHSGKNIKLFIKDEQK